MSLDGASAPTHDRVRGVGSFAETMAGTARLAAAGLGRRTAIAFTEMRDNMQDVPALLELVDRLRLRGVVGGTLLQDGSAARNALQPPTSAQYRALLSLYHASARFRELYERYGRFCAVEWWKGRSAARGDPCAFVEHPYVSAHGKIYPCRLHHADDFAVIPASDAPLAADLGDALPRWSQLVALARARPANLPECRGCAAELPCAGGCMGRALAACGSAAASEDRCALRKAVQVWADDRDGERSITDAISWRG